MPGRAAAPRGRRVFFALWPAPAVRGALAARAGVVHAECGGRLMPAGNLHLTLVFIGNVRPGRIAELERIAASIAASRCELVLDLLRYWPHNRIVWAGASVVPPALAVLVDALNAGLREGGFRTEERPYAPHITLVRDARHAPAARAFEPIAWQAGDFALVESAQADGASRYEPLAHWPLGG